MLNGLKAGLALLVLAFLLRSLDWDMLMQALWSAHPAWFVLALFANGAQLVLAAWRWQMLLYMLIGERLPLVMLVRYYVMGGFVNNFTPANLGGDAIRIGILARQGRDTLASTGSVVLERALSLAGLLLLATWALSFQVLPVTVTLPHWLPGAAVVAMLLLLSLAAGWMWYRTRAAAALRIRMLQLLCRCRRQPQVFGSAILVTLLQHLAMMLITLATFNAVGVNLPLDVHLACYAIAALLLTLPLTIQGLGVREGIYLGLMGLLGVAATHTLAALALNYLILVLFSSGGALLFWFSIRQLRSQAG